MNSWIYKKDEKKNKKLYFRFHYITQHKIADMRNHWHFYFLHHIDSFAISFYCENQINKLFNILSKESWREIGASKIITEETDIEIRFAFYRLDRNVISQFFFFIFMYRSLTKCHFFFSSLYGECSDVLWHNTRFRTDLSMRIRNIPIHIEFHIAMQIFNGIHMFGLKRILHNRRIRASGNRYTSENGDISCYLVYNGVCSSVSWNGLQYV